MVVKLKESQKIKKNKEAKESHTHKILVTAALPYANGPIHVGHLVEYIQTDIFVRFLKLTGKDVIYCCADDTHGTPIEIKAKQLGIKPEKLINDIWKEHVKDFEDFHIKFDSYYTTNSPENKFYSEYIYNKLKEKGLIYKKSIDLIYCGHCKRFLPDRFVKGTCPNCRAEEQYGDVCEKCGTAHKTTDLINPKCTLCSNKPVKKQSEHYFFKLSKCADQLLHFLKEKKLQKEVVNFCMTWLEKLEDWCISRDGPYFGFKIPGEEGKYFYVWLDAPVGYIASTANYCKNIAKGKDKAKDKKGKKLTEKDYWFSDKSEIIHVIGKDIIYFHFLFWPAMLINAGIHVPDQIQVHGFLTINKEKMSKSRGTFITARQYLQHLNPEYLRFYYASNLTSKLEDIDLDVKDFREKINHELIGNLSNFANRVVSFTNANFSSKIIQFDVEDKAVQGIINEFKKKATEVRNYYHHFDFREAVKDILYLGSLGNKYFQDNEPWKSVKGNDEEKIKAHKCLSFCVNILKNLSIMIAPILPEFSQKLQEQLNVNDLGWDDIHFDIAEHKLGKAEVLLKKIENELGEIIKPQKPQEAGSGDGIRDESLKFKSSQFNLDLRVGKVIRIEEHPEADKLYILQVDLGKNKEGKEEKRQLVAGLRQFMKKEEILGKNIIVLCNLEHAKLKGKTSEGMLLAADKKIKGKGEGQGKEIVKLLLAEKSKHGDKVYADKPSDKFETINFKQFQEYKFEVKNKNVFWNSKPLKTSKELISVDIEDGANIE